MKYPSDKFSVFPNSFWLNECNLTVGEEKENYNVSADGMYIYSKDIFKVASDAKTLKGDEASRSIDLYGSMRESSETVRNPVSAPELSSLNRMPASTERFILSYRIRQRKLRSPMFLLLPVIAWRTWIK